MTSGQNLQTSLYGWVLKFSTKTGIHALPYHASVSRIARVRVKVTLDYYSSTVQWLICFQILTKVLLLGSFWIQNWRNFHQLSSHGITPIPNQNSLYDKTVIFWLFNKSKLINYLRTSFYINKIQILIQRSNNKKVWQFKSLTDIMALYHFLSARNKLECLSLASIPA
jgi:hypothetical protein